MNLEEIKKEAKSLILEWPHTDDEIGWAIQVIIDILGPLCEGDPEAEKMIKYIEKEYLEEG